MMQKTRTRPNMYLSLLIVFLGCVLFFFGGLCYTIIRATYPPDTRAPDVFPDTELVFTTINGAGFINTDGSNEADLDFSASKPWMIAGTTPADIGRALVTGDNRTLIARVSDYNGYWYISGDNHLVIWRAGEKPLFCQSWGIQPQPLLTRDQKHILIQTEQGMALYKLTSCGTDDEPVAVYEDLSGVLSPDLQYAAIPAGFGDERAITIRNLNTGEERLIEKGDFPAWSPDSRSLAYTGVDGIYVVNIAEQTGPVRVVLQKNPLGEIHPTYSEIDKLPPPEAAWSADGQWLVYHRLTIEDYSGKSDKPNLYSIFKANITTREEIRIVDGGMYPSWRWDVE